MKVILWAFTTLYYMSAVDLLSFVHKHSNKLNLFLHSQYLWWHMNDTWWKLFCLDPLVFLPLKNFTLFGFPVILAMRVTWWWFFQKRFVHTKLDIYAFTEHCVCIVMLQMITYLWTMFICVLSCLDEYKIEQLSIFVL